MNADLHVHSTASDGTLRPSQLVALAIERGVDVLAIADHDSVSGLPEAIGAAEGSSLTLIPAVEFSAVLDEYSVHILAYYVDPDSMKLREELALFRRYRLERAERMVEALRSGGLDLSMSQVLALSDGGAVGRSHIARALVDSGHADTVSAAFQRYVGRDSEFYRQKESRTPAQVIATILESGAIPVVAHPGVSEVDAVIPSMVDSGLLGIEAYHADHTPEQRLRYAAMAHEMGLLTTGGTDYHGPTAHNPELGTADVPDESVRALLQLGPRY